MTCDISYSQSCVVQHTPNILICQHHLVIQSSTHDFDASQSFRKGFPLSADHLALLDLDMLEALDAINPILGWSAPFGNKELASLCDVMLERLQCEFAQRIHDRRSFGFQHASSVAWTFDSSHIWKLLSKHQWVHVHVQTLPCCRMHWHSGMCQIALSPDFLSSFLHLAMYLCVLHCKCTDICISASVCVALGI